MTEPTPIIFTADIKSLKVLSGRPVVQIMLEADKAMFEAEEMSEAYSAIGHACLKDDSYKIMFMKSTDAEEVIKHGKAKEEPKYPDKPIVSEGFPWRILEKESFGNFLLSRYNQYFYNIDEAPGPKRNKRVVKEIYKVDTTKQMTHDQINGLINEFNEWLRGGE